MINFLFGADREGGGFFGVKWAQSQPIFAGFFQGDAFGDDFEDITGILNVLDFFPGDDRCQVAPPPLKFRIGNSEPVTEDAVSGQLPFMSVGQTGEDSEVLPLSIVATVFTMLMNPHLKTFKLRFYFKIVKSNIGFKTARPATITTVITLQKRMDYLLGASSWAV